MFLFNYALCIKNYELLLLVLKIHFVLNICYLMCFLFNLSVFKQQKNKSVKHKYPIKLLGMRTRQRGYKISMATLY